MITPPRLAPWMIAVMVLIGGGICFFGWLVMHPPASGSATPAPPPFVAKPLPPRVRPDPVENFDKVAARGLSEGLLGRILEDFEMAGLRDDGGGEDELAPEILTWREKRWYLEALSSGLGLDQAQRDEAMAALAKLPDEPPEGENGRTFPVGPLPRACPGWLASAAAAPWALCHLTERQQALTGFAAWGEAGNEALAGAATDPELALAAILPLSEPQQSAAQANGGGEEAQCHSLHPAQAELWLLISGAPDWLLEKEGK